MGEDHKQRGLEREERYNFLCPSYCVYFLLYRTTITTFSYNCRRNTQPMKLLLPLVVKESNLYLKHQNHQHNLMEISPLL